MSKSTKGTLGYWEVTAIGIGGMVGGGMIIFLAYEGFELIVSDLADRNHSV